jgi:tetratricopeptide (TPR) repeat protein
MKLVKAIFYRVAMPAFVGLITEHIAHYMGPQLWEGIKAVLPSLAELLHFAAQVGIASILAEEVLKHSLVPAARDISRSEFIPELAIGFDKIRESLSSGLLEKGLLIREQLTIERGRETTKLQEALSQSPELEEAKQLLIDGQLGKAIRLLEALANQKPEHRLHLLSALLASPQIENWSRARDILSDGIGNASHYLRLSYNYWVKGDLPGAIAITELGLERFKDDTRNNGDALRLKNSLSYYYSDAYLLEKEDLSLSFAEEVVSNREKNGESSSLGSALATRGYAKISFGKNKQTIGEGIKDCEDGRRMGAREDLYFRHLARAQERLAKMP